LSDKRYSIDDILNEYAKPEYVDQRKKSAAADYELNELLKSYDVKEASSAADKLSESLEDIRGSLSHTDFLPNPVTPDVSDIKIQFTSEVLSSHAKKARPKPKPKSAEGEVKKLPEQPEPPKKSAEASAKGKASKTGLSFSEKFDLGVNYDNSRHKLSGERSFSDKFEMDDLYEDERKDKRTKERSSKISFTSTLRIGGTKSDPFEKYSSISEADSKSRGLTNEEESRGVYGISMSTYEKKPRNAEKSLDEILEEYSPPSDKRRNKAQSNNKGLTDFFIRKGDSEESGVPERTELLNGMMRMKKERLQAAPIERKSINDIDLHLDDKILPNTAPVEDTIYANEYDKLKALKERRSKKIKDFVLAGDEEETEEEASTAEAERVIDDFDDFEDAPSILNDIAQLKSSMAMRLLVLVFCLLSSLYVVLANDTELLPIMDMLDKREQVNIYLFVNTTIGLLAAFSSYTVISSGLSKLFSLNADCDTLAAASVVSSIAASMAVFADTGLIKLNHAHVYIPLAIAALTFNAYGKLLIINRTLRSFKFISGAGDKYAVVPVSDMEKAESFTRGALRDFPAVAAMKKTEFLTEFLKTAYSPDAADRFCRLFAPAVLGASLIAGVAGGLIYGLEYEKGGLYMGLSLFAGCIAICSGFSIMLNVNLPLSKASKTHAEAQGAILGYDCIEEFADVNCILADAKDLFPQGSVTLAAIKVFSDTRIDEAIVEAASLANQADSILKSMFYEIIGGKTELLNHVESYIYEDSMGLCGWINNKRVLLGSRELMDNHSIENLPSAEKEKEYIGDGIAVYLSISGELSAVFAVRMASSLEVKPALEELEKHGIYVVLRSVDSIVTINRLSDIFEVSPEYFKLLPFRIHPDYEEVTSYQSRTKATIACSGKFSVFSSLLLSCKHIRGTVSAGIWIQATSTALGFLIFMAMILTKSFSELSVSTVTMYSTIFLLILIGVQSIRKN